MAGKLSPMMVHYLKVKEEYSDCIVFYRLGDFYEMFFDDAITASKELELTLTGRDCGMEERAPMCGVPFHSAEIYISRLISAGYKVAICEQTEDPKKAKGIVAREVIRVITPGTATDEAILEDGANNYLVVMCMENGRIGFSAVDASTGEMYATELAGSRFVLDELARYAPKEIIVNDEFSSELEAVIDRSMHLKFERREEIFTDDYDEIVCNQFGRSLAELKFDTKQEAARAAAAALVYIRYAQKSSIDYLNRISVYESESYMELDFATRRNLEITETMRDKAKRGSLFWVLDKTKTSMGRRKLRQWLERPLLNPIDINKRLTSVKELTHDTMLRDDLIEILKKTYDISRIISRLALRTVTPKDMVSLKQTLLQLPSLEYKLSGMKSPMFAGMYKNFDILDDVAALIERAIDEEKATSIIREGGMIKKGYNEEADRLRSAKENGTDWLKEVEAEERERTGIPKLRTGFNRVFGYYIEVTNSYKSQVPDDYIRKQTLTNAERYITPKLKEIENTILGASERLVALEIQLFNELCDKLAGELERMKRAARTIAVTDVLCSLAEVAHKNNYCMPDVVSGDVIDIKDGRHPVVEKLSKDIIFVPNDSYLNGNDDRLLIITGPNMAGKSTYMRQTAVITLMAQVGSFVPASSARIGVVDRIFTRVGASDDIASGQSTFMLEMTEVSNILKNATKNSLIILDEIGRGTSTYDGLSIAWAVAEYIHSKRKIGAKTMFATHYHEMTELEDNLEGVKNYRIAVNKRGDEITFLRRIVRGGADESYGIEVAALAGVPNEVIKRAKAILNGIVEGETDKLYKKPKKAEAHGSAQMEFGDMAGREIIEELKNMDVTTMTAIDTMNKLYQLSLKAKEL
ncbi:MAG: DNA mismatch repair protein MutS [Oscillospiraceae bacterium]|nr:DNA mismatch repair protein MutS [Oscillospiraceae bacterium]